MLLDCKPAAATNTVLANSLSKCVVLEVACWELLFPKVTEPSGALVAKACKRRTIAMPEHCVDGSLYKACLLVLTVMLTLVKANTDKQRVMPRTGNEHHHH